MAETYPILARLRDRNFGPAVREDFTLGPGTQVDPEEVLKPGWSLYTLDLDRAEALFLRLPLGTDLSQAAFVQHQQYEVATELLTLPLDLLPGLSLELAQPRTRVLLFSMGRCGTTLMNNVLNQVPGVWALSEPRAPLVLAQARHRLTPERARDLVGAVMRFAWAPPPGKGADCLVVKFHSQVLFQAEAYAAAFPEARYLFMYRDAESWASSFSRFMQNMGMPLALDREQLHLTWSILTCGSSLHLLRPWTDPDSAVTGHAAVLTAGWALYIEEYQRLVAAGLRFLPLSYGALEADRAGQLQRVLAHCGLSDATMHHALAAFDKDSQEGTGIGRDTAAKGFGPEDRALVRAALAQGPGGLRPDLVL